MRFRQLGDQRRRWREQHRVAQQRSPRGRSRPPDGSCRPPAAQQQHGLAVGDEPSARQIAYLRFCRSTAGRRIENPRPDRDEREARQAEAHIDPALVPHDVALTEHGQGVPDRQLPCPASSIRLSSWSRSDVSSAGSVPMRWSWPLIRNALRRWPRIRPAAAVRRASRATLSPPRPSLERWVFPGCRRSRWPW